MRGETKLFLKMIENLLNLNEFNLNFILFSSIKEKFFNWLELNEAPIEI